MIPFPRPPIGNGAMAQFGRSVLELIRERTPQQSSAYGLQVGTNGWRLDIPKSTAGGGSSTQRMIIKGIDSDWFYCLAYDSNGQSPAGTPNWQAGVTPQSDYILVAKPWELRFSPWDGQTIDGITFSYADATLNYARRKATMGSVTEFHIVVRPWYLGEIILAQKRITGGTDQQDNGTPADIPNSIPAIPPADLIWEDTNQAAHAWAQTDTTDPGDASL